MCEWLIKIGQVNVETEPDLKDFNNWIKRHRGKEYCRNTVKSAFNCLVENRVVNLVKRYTWRIVKIVTRPLEFLKPKRKLQKLDILDSLHRSFGMFVDDVSLLQQHILITDNQLLFSQYGIRFDETDKEVLNRPKNEVLLSIACYQIADTRKVTQANQTTITRGKIENPEGWIRTCLRRRYWDKPRTYQQIANEYGHTTFWDELFPSNG